MDSTQVQPLSAPSSGREDGVRQHEDARDHPVERLHDRAADGDEGVPDRHRYQQSVPSIHTSL